MGINQNWTPARIYNVYRIAIASALLLLHFAPASPLLGKHDPPLFETTIIVYLTLTLVSTALDFRLARRRPLWMQPLALMVDLIVLVLIVHANGGLEGGLAVLLLVTVAAGNILLRGRLGYLVASLATLAVMFEQFYFSVQQQLSSPFQLTESGLLGIAFFMVSLIIQQIARRLDQSEYIARRQRAAIDRLEALNQQIVQRMRTGVLVFNRDFIVQMSNASADNLFGVAMLGRHLPGPLIERHQRWSDNPQLPLETIKVSEQSPALSPRFANMDTGHETQTLLFLEDSARVAQEAQQMNLASLGRLSATLAHEIRNPLSAINHATELLADGERSDEDRQLLNIIRNHVTRVNGIIHDVLDLSRRSRSQAERLSLREFINELCEQRKLQGLTDEQLVHASPNDTLVRFDRNQLSQILNNLVDNALHHGGAKSKITFEYGRHLNTDLPWLRIRDNGKGISDEEAQFLFEPFYTTASNGNGLGLYVCRELCQANQATLDYEPGQQGASFVITFAHPNRQFQ
ncbi:two-component sensor histidine kinase [Alcanivorax hongdengensis A-11-3]|uniref:histidine kinase n=1 Tax=Alcanivorax hongdengensis A-11-3 TaxID=1177179 RepID=L0WCN3_9GAMM|nr:ATP-binding protein [Alcanivorax hongdengensis]EKF74498.1 two-component sensor histidine kinase [Alcanivorax hongdengensis A-11-3]